MYRDIYILYICTNLVEPSPLEGRPRKYKQTHSEVQPCVSQFLSSVKYYGHTHVNIQILGIVVKMCSFVTFCVYKFKSLTAENTP